MIRNLLTIIWNQRKTNLLIFFEIMISFLVLLFVMTQVVSNLSNYFQPLGFDYTNVWYISAANKGSEWPEEEKQIYNALREFPEIVSIGTMWLFPYAGGGWTSDFSYNGASLTAVISLAGLDLADVLRIKIMDGRWFSHSDYTTSMVPAVVNTAFSERFFGDENPIGKIFSLANPQIKHEFRIIGMLDDFKINGEFSANGPSIFIPVEKNPNPQPVQNFIIRVTPGATAKLEEEIVQKIQSIAKRVTVRIDRLEDLRRSYLRNEAAPLFAGGIIAAFMLLMVVLGLSGVLWLNVSRRIKEIGLRRAKGATRNNIYNQMTGELLCISAIGIAAGNLIAVQFRLFDFMGFLSMNVYATSALVSSGIILLISYACSIYPSYLAAKVHPAEALRAE